MSKYKRLIQDSALFFMNSFVSKLLGFVLVALYTRFMLPEEYGIVEILYDTSSMIVPFFTLGITDGIMRFALDKNNNRSEILDIAVKILGVATIILIIATPIYYSSFDKFSYVVFFQLLTITSAFALIFGSFVKGLEKTKIFAINGILRMASLVIANIFLLVIFKLGATGYLLSLLISEFVSLAHYLVCGGVFKYFKRTKTNKKMLKDLIKYSVPLISNTVCWKIVSISDRYFLKHFITDAAVGIYTVSNKLPTLISLVSTIFIQAWQITGTREYNAGTFKETFSKVKDLYIFVMTLGTIGIMSVYKPFSILIFDEQYIESYLYSPLLFLGVYLNSIVGIVGSLYMIQKKTKYIFYSSLCAALVNVGLNFFAVPKFGSQGAALTTAVAYAVALLVRVVAMHREDKSIKVKPKNIFYVLLTAAFSLFMLTDSQYVFYMGIALIIMLVISQPNYIDMIFNFIRTKVLKRGKT